MKCPICDHRVADGKIRCVNCSTALTFWINLDLWAHKAYTAALQTLRDGDVHKAADLLLRAAISAPENAAYLAACGRVFAQAGRFREAAHVLGKACELDPTEANQAALQRAQTLAAGGDVSGSTRAEQQKPDEPGPVSSGCGAPTTTVNEEEGIVFLDTPSRTPSEHSDASNEADDVASTEEVSSSDESV